VRAGPRGGPYAEGVLIPAGVTLLVVVTTAVGVLGAGRTDPLPLALLGWALILAVCGTLFLGRRYPVAACVCALVGTGVFYVVSTLDGPLVVVLMLCLYGVAAAGRTAVAAVLGALWLVFGLFGFAAGSSDVNGVALSMMAGWVVAMVALGVVRYGRQEYARAAVREAEADAKRRAAEERLRIARELHDVVGHHLSMINVQAGTALHRLERAPDQAGPALKVIKEASRDSLRELRSTLGALRQVDEEEATAPAGGLDRLDDLVRYAELASLAVDVRTEGERKDVPARVDLAAYRILQESITNVTRHAAARKVRMTVAYEPAELRLEIEDDGHGGAGRPAGTGGDGIRGMRERARALGGDLIAGPSPDGGFRVRARLPYGDAP
jgi:signal transduction histidine kinase